MWQKKVNIKHFRLRFAVRVANNGNSRDPVHFWGNYKAFLASMRSLVFRGVASLWAPC